MCKLVCCYLMNLHNLKQPCIIIYSLEALSCKGPLCPNPTLPLLTIMSWRLQVWCFSDYNVCIKVVLLTARWQQRQHFQLVCVHLWGPLHSRSRCFFFFLVHIPMQICIYSKHSKQWHRVYVRPCSSTRLAAGCFFWTTTPHVCLVIQLLYFCSNLWFN